MRTTTKTTPRAMAIEIRMTIPVERKSGEQTHQSVSKKKSEGETKKGTHFDHHSERNW